MTEKKDSTNKKQYIVRILDIIKENSDKDNPITTKEIMEILESNYGWSLDRKTVQANIKTLIDMEYPIEYKERIPRGDSEICKGIYYNWDDSGVDESILRLLIDSVLTSKHISSSMADDVIGWLRKQGSASFRKRLATVKSADYGYHMYDQDIFLNTDDIGEAISQDRKISFTYNDFNEDGKLVPKEADIVVSPYHSFMANSHYYLICNRDGTDSLQHYRIDKINNLKILEKEKRTELKKIKPDFNIDEYINSHIYMFAGDTRQVLLKIKKSCFSALFDYFGDSFKTQKDDNEDSEYRTVRIKTNLEGMYYWALQYGDNVEILEPQELRDRIRHTAIRMSQTYNVTNDDRYSEALQELEKDRQIIKEREHDRRLFKPILHLDLQGIDLKGKTQHRDIPDLRSVRIGDNNITDYTFLNNYENLRSLRIDSHTPIDLSNVELPTLRSVTISGDVWSDEPLCYENLNFLENFPGLHSVRLSSIKVNDSTALYKIQNPIRIEIPTKTAENIDPKHFTKYPTKIKKDRYYTSYRFYDIPEHR